MATEYKLSYTAQEIDKKLKEIVPPDFAQNDSSAPDYIKNRTHWVGAPVTTTEVTLEEQTIEFIETNDISINIVLVDNAECVVTWDGVEYITKTEVLNIGDMCTVVMGNLAIADPEEEDNGQPFCFYYFVDMNLCVLQSNDTTLPASHTVKIVSNIATQEIHKLNGKYIDSEWLASREVEAVEIVPETTIVFENGMSPFKADASLMETIKTINIVWDGVEYNKVPYIMLDLGVFYFGNLTYIDIPLGLNLPFFGYIEHEDIVLFIVDAEDTNDHQIKMSIERYIYNKLPFWYLPDKFAASKAHGGSALSAERLNVSAGSATQPVYFENGIPVVTTHTLGKTVPANAVFTDTRYRLLQNDSTVTLTGSDGTTSSITIDGTSGLPEVTIDDNGKTVKVVDGEWSVEQMSYNDLSNKPTFGVLASKNTVSKTDLVSDVQTSLGKADTALQSYTETDPTVPAWAKTSTKPTYTASEVGAVPTTRTINGKALSSNISLSASDVGAVTIADVNSAIEAAIGAAIAASY